MAFIDRERELSGLEAAWREKAAQFYVIWGKRRIGKTELIKRFIKDKSHIYHLCQRLNDTENRRALGESVGEHFHDSLVRAAGFPDWKAFFVYLKERVKSRTVLVIDEYPYLAEANKGISSTFQAGWDEYLKEVPIFLILCGSSIAMMESEVLAQKAPLFGRRTGQLFLRPFSFSDSRKFYPKVAFERCLEFYALAGGNPTYLERLDPKASLEQNVTDKIFRPDAFLAREVEFILREELREPRNYFAILKAISFGKTRIGEIVNETGLEKGVLHKYLFILEDLHVVRKDVPATEHAPLKSRKGVYELQDQFFKFWFRHVLPNRGRIEEGRLEGALERFRQDFPGLVSENYEKAAREIVRDREELFFPFERVGKWWNRQEEIDLVALNEERREILFGEVKWSRRPVGTDIYRDLRRKARLVDWNAEGRRERFCLFSKSGFTKSMLALARAEGVALFHKDRLIGTGLSR